MDELDTFTYFSNAIRWNPAQSILDFGSNSGNLLRSSTGVLLPENYTGIDVDPASLSLGKEKFPQAKWVLYDRYNPAYNHTGKNVLPDLAETFDIIISYSVFTHMTNEDMMETLDYLYTRLNANSSIYFTYCNLDNAICNNWFTNKRIKEYGSCEKIQGTDFVYLIDSKLSKVSSGNCRHFVSFHSEDFILNYLAKFNPEVAYRAQAPWAQDCIKITKGNI